MKKVVVTIAIVAFLAISLSFLMNRDGAIAGTEGSSYVPGNKCKTCHIKLFKAHAKTLHAMSFENLTDSGQEANADCLKCHTTGYGEPGGYVDAASSADLGGTTCQACHGPGRAHVEKGLSKEQRRETIARDPQGACTKCHRPHEAHPDVGVDTLKKKIERLQSKVAG